MFRYNIDKLASPTEFRSEHQMESFLYNNPEIIGILKDASGEKVDDAIIQQFPTQKGEGGKGRIDLIALNSDKDLNIVLKIIELKKKAVKEDFLQLKGYLEGLKKENPWKAELEQFIKENGGIDDNNIIKNIYNDARGIFIAGDFEPELLFEIYNWNKNKQNNQIELFKLLQFKTKESSFILLDKIIEQPTSETRKRSFTWNIMVNQFNELNIGDIFYIKKQYTNEDPIEFNITESKLFVTLTNESIKLMREKRYLDKCEEFGSNVENFPNFKKASKHLATEVFPKKTWDNDDFKKILSEETSIEDISEIKIAISNLFQLVLLANSKNRMGWNFGRSIIHKKTGKPYQFFKDNLT